MRMRISTRNLYSFSHLKISLPQIMQKKITEGALAYIEIDRMYSTVCFDNLSRSPRSQITVFEKKQ